MDTREFDVVVVGGGTAGSVVASRLSADPDVSVCLIEGGPSDVGDQRILQLRNWINLLESEFDYDYPIVPQARGNSHLRHARARVLGGCSSHNTMISFLPPPEDFADWVRAGAAGWSYEEMVPLWKRLAINIVPVAPKDRNPLAEDFVAACHAALGVPIHDDFNAGPFADGAGFFPVGYHPETGVRSSASVAYLHPHLDRPNLTILTDHWAYHLDPDHGISVKVGQEGRGWRGKEGDARQGGGLRGAEWDDSRVRRDGGRSGLEWENTGARRAGGPSGAEWEDREKRRGGGGGGRRGVEWEDGGGRFVRIRARHEYVLCAGAIDTPRLLLHSGIGPAEQLERLGIKVRADVPGVGENLLDHPESLILWEAGRPIPPMSAMDSDAGLFVRRDAGAARPDLMFHLYQIPFTFNTERLGYDVPAHGFGMTPNVPRPRSSGRLTLADADPGTKPLLDFRYFTDPDGYDERTIVDGLRLAREVAATEPFASWIAREIAPGPGLRSDQELSAYGRAAHHTVYHPAGTCRMGSPSDELAVVDPELRLKGVPRVRIADASVFPMMPTVNPMVAVLMIGERAADLISAELNRA